MSGSSSDQQPDGRVAACALHHYVARLRRLPLLRLPSHSSGLGWDRMELPGQLQLALGSSYRIERELGQGGMATVYLAEDVRHHRKGAIKALRPELAASMGPDRK